MLYVPVDLPESIKDLEQEIIAFINKNMMSVMDPIIDEIDEPEYDSQRESYFPCRFYVNHRERSIDILYELYNILKSHVMYYELSPIYEFVLYSILNEYSDFETDFPEDYKFTVPEELKRQITAGFYEEYNDGDILERVLDELESCNGYIELIFEDFDFLDDHDYQYSFLDDTLK